MPRSLVMSLQASVELPIKDLLFYYGLLFFQALQHLSLVLMTDIYSELSHSEMRLLQMEASTGQRKTRNKIRIRLL